MNEAVLFQRHTTPVRLREAEESRLLMHAKTKGL